MGKVQVNPTKKITGLQENTYTRRQWRGRHRNNSLHHSNFSWKEERERPLCKNSGKIGKAIKRNGEGIVLKGGMNSRKGKVGCQ